MTETHKLASNGAKTVKIAIYCRVSTSEQTTENQRISLVKYAEQQGWQYEIFEETESTRNQRPVKQHLLHALNDKQYDGILVYKLDRYARSSAELVIEIKQLVENGILFISLTDNLNFGTASGKLHFQILCAFAEFERELIRERTLEGLKRAEGQGKKPGRPKGAQDKKQRPNGGYIIREALKRKKADESSGIYKHIKSYMS